MIYTVLIEKSAKKQLAKIPAPHFDRITDTILKLQENPRPMGHKKLKGRPGYRIRVGDYRIIYMIEDNRLLVLVIDIGHRQGIYD